MRINNYLSYILLLFLSVFTLDARCQELKRFDSILSQGTSLNIFANEGEATIQVLVLGSIGSAGVYEISPDIRIDQLLALTGGVQISDDVRVTIQLYRESPGERILIYETRVEDMLAETSEYPELMAGDVFVVKTKQKFKFDWRDTVRIITSITSIAGLIRLFR